jgi:hypothetical protein
MSVYCEVSAGGLRCQERSLLRVKWEGPGENDEVYYCPRHAGQRLSRRAWKACLASISTPGSGLLSWYQITALAIAHGVPSMTGHGPNYPGWMLKRSQAYL